MDQVVRTTSARIWYANIIKDAVCTEGEAVLTTILGKRRSGHGVRRQVLILTARATNEDTPGAAWGRSETTGKGKMFLLRLKGAVRKADLPGRPGPGLAAMGKLRQAGDAYMNRLRPEALELQQFATELVVYEREQAALYYGRGAVKTYERNPNPLLPVLTALSSSLSPS